MARKTYLKLLDAEWTCESVHVRTQVDSVVSDNSARTAWI